MVQKREMNTVPDEDQPISKAYFKEAYFAANKQLAKQGDRFAQFNLAYQYMTGYGGVPVDIDQAIFWYTQSGQQGLPNAYMRLADIYANRLYSHFERDSADAKQAVHYLLLLYDTQPYFVSIALERLKPVLRYLSEEFIQANPTLSRINRELMSTLRKQADLENDAKAECELGLTYLLGFRGMKKDPDLGFIYIKRSAEQGLSTAQAALALFYIANEGSIPRDLDKAVDWAGKAMRSAHTEQETQAAEDTGAFLVKSALEHIQLIAQKLKHH